MSLQRLRAFTAEKTVGLEDLLELSAFARQFASECLMYKEDVPVWVRECQAHLKQAITQKQRDALELREKQLQTLISTTKTREERRRDAEAELALVRQRRQALGLVG